MYNVVSGPSRNSIPVIGSSDSKTVLCLAPRSCIKSPRITVTAPFPNPTASCERFPSAANAEICHSQTSEPMVVQEGDHTGNCLRPFCIDKVDKHFGPPVFFSSLSKAHTLSTGSFDRSSATVTRSAVALTCLMWVIEPVSCALKFRTTLKADDRIRTLPSLPPTKRLSEPEQMELNSLLLQSQHRVVYSTRRKMRQTSNAAKVSLSSAGFTSATSKKLKVFHFRIYQLHSGPLG